MRIIVERGGVAQIAQELKVNRNTVAAALAGTTRTARAREIRELAVAKYGGVAVEYKIPVSTQL